MNIDPQTIRKSEELQIIIPRVFKSIFWQYPEYVLHPVTPIHSYSPDSLLYQIIRKETDQEVAKIYLDQDPFYSQTDEKFALTFRTFWKSVETHRTNLHACMGRGTGKIAPEIEKNLSEYENVFTIPPKDISNEKYAHCKKASKACAACASYNTLLVEYKTHTDQNGTADTWEIFCCDCKYTSHYSFNDKS
jgi:hypothetical protein